MRKLTLVLALLAAPALGYEGTITASGYQPPAAPVWVTWCRAGSDPQCRSFKLNAGVSWNGQDGPSKFGRYAGGDASVQGWSTVPAVAGESRGGEIGAALLFLYRKAGISREYTTAELWDFAFANSCGGYSCGCSWYERITGSPHPVTPGCQSETSSGGLKPCPADPPGCGKKASPCLTDDPKIPAGVPTQIACSTGTGRVGRFVLRPAGSGSPDPPPAGGGGGSDPVPPAAARCFVGKLEAGILTGKEVPCEDGKP